METLWFAVFAVLLAGYFALEGFDLGVGLLLPVLGRTQERRDRMVAAVAPFVLANEVWLVAVAGTLIGVYPALEGEILFSLYPLVVAMLVSWVLRDAGLWFRRRADGDGWRALWDLAIAGGSLGLAMGWGMALYALATGSGPIHPIGILVGAFVALAFAFHGWTFLGWRLKGFAGVTRSGRDLLLSGLVAAAPAIIVLVGAAGYLLEHSAPSATLTTLGLMVVPFAPVIVGAQVWVWRAFRTSDRIPSFF
ncbi:cytochrome d ubiquinol oxidase subunit II [Thermoactinospora rubra]|uniref:cytochrome d ubiquinol oxidase subunit II n=1 Tax=Thermoactinospora rubra TaxID=1088767 RepID=UPI000A10B998|nr:cytochrome d ubiquinol oxidase subunit II [Thermoactinospora rubra]